MRKLPNWFASGVCRLGACLCLVALALPLMAAKEAKPEGKPSRTEPAEPEKEQPEEMEEAEEEPEAYSYALFLKKPRQLTQEMLVEAAAKAWEMKLVDARKLKITLKDNEGSIRFQGVTFEIAGAAEPWLEDQAQIIKETNDRQMRAMLKRVTSHISITVANDFKDDDLRDTALEHGLRLLGAMVDPKDTLAIYDDDTGDFNYIDDEVLEAIVGEDPHSAFDINVAPAAGKLPVSSPQLKAAVAEARRRWPEFAKSFRDYGEERGPYLIKATLGEGSEQEDLWCELVSMRPGKIRAILKNTPVHQSNLTKGEQLDFPLEKLVDWTYPDEEGDRIGAFTVDLPER